MEIGGIDPEVLMAVARKRKAQADKRRKARNARKRHNKIAKKERRKNKQ